jgi:hypothetical protein
MHPDDTTDLSNQDLEALFKLADKIGRKRYHKLTKRDFESYRKFDHWRYVGGDSECGTTDESRHWVRENSESYCPICQQKFSRRQGKTIDHKLPRAKYPWLALDFQNFWVICRMCNLEKREKDWYEYERYILEKYPDRYTDVKFARPTYLLKQL